MTSLSFVVEPVQAAEVWSIRQEVLRPNLPLSEAVFDGDDDPKTLHVGVRSKDDLVGVGTLIVDRFRGADSWRVRGMAVLEHFRGFGCGSKILEALLEHADANQPEWVVWCNARLRALSLYETSGFVVVGEEFVIATVGVHRLMVRPSWRVRNA
ncbi:MAG: GNAT family N-acetyltransferase [Ferrimicrobium sp.]